MSQHNETGKNSSELNTDKKGVNLEIHNLYQAKLIIGVNCHADDHPKGDLWAISGLNISEIYTDHL